MSENKAYQIWLPLLFSIFTVGGVLIGYNLQKPTPIIHVSEDGTELSGEGTIYGASKMEEVLRYIDARYVDNVKRDELIEDAIDKLLEELDPHSKFIPAKDLEGINESMEGNFVGIGVEFSIIRDTVMVLAVIPEGPSSDIGIMPGDRLVMVNDSIITGEEFNSDTIKSLLRGEEGSIVKVGVKRQGQDKILDFDIERGSIPINSVDATIMLNKKTGYIKINRFSETTYDEFRDGMADLIDAGMEDLIIDLRQNPGGYLRQATRILNQIINSNDELLVYTEGKHSPKKEYVTKGGNKPKIDDVALLMDGGSASASEIMAGAIQDTDRGIVLGRRSFGKGLVQEQYELSDGSALRLTIARYYTKSGRLIQKSYGEGTDYHGDAEDRFENGELDAESNITLSDSTEFFTDNGRIVYGSAGILPDIFVPMDSLYKNEAYLVATDYSSEFIFGLLDRKRSSFLELGLSNFDSKYEVNDQVYDDFINHVKGKNQKFKQLDFSKVKAEIKQHLKEIIAKNIYGLDAYYKVRSIRDDMIQEALEHIDDSEYFLKED